MTTSVTLYDKSDLRDESSNPRENAAIGDVPLNDILRALSEAGLQSDIKYDLSIGWKQSRLIIGHMPKGEIATAHNYEGEGFQIVLVLTRQRPGWGIDDASHDLTTSRCVFYCRDVLAILTPGAINQVLDLSYDEAAKIVNDRIDDCPQALKNLLFSQPQPFFLSALSILCQGYLAVQSGPDPQSDDGFRVEVEDSAGEIRSALQDMKWGEVFKPGIKEDWLDPRLVASESTSRQPLRDEVSSASYWGVFGEMETKKFREALALEWKAISGKTFEGSKTATLVESLPRIPSPEHFSRIVAEAFLELNHVLGGAKHA